MSLIICTECGKQISEYAEFCPNCGCPMNVIKNKNKELINNLPEEITCPICGVTRSKNVFISNDYRCDICKFDIRMKKEDVISKENENQIPNQPKCPTCQSTKIKKISATSKVANTALFGILGTKRHKTFHCNSCGYEW